ncbi:MAG: hypothetical protein HYT48_01535 [Candidatus Vogelbacteria bacterium]|nr:hypothetical protein [Candidatus Vogelbacteria bacterium]
MNHKTYFKTAGIIFLAIALMHLLRLVYGWEAVIGGTIVPVWASWVALIIGAYLGFKGLKFGKN